MQLSPGAIGSVLFVQIGVGLAASGPGTLLFAFILWATVVVAVNSCLAEMVCWIPISSLGVGMAGSGKSSMGSSIGSASSSCRLYHETVGMGGLARENEGMSFVNSKP